MRIELRDRLARPQVIAFVIGAVLSALSIVLGLAQPAQFFRSYLYTYFFWIGVTVGCLAIVMLHHVSSGAWGAVVLRFVEAGSLTLPLMAVLFVPIVLGIGVLYPWARPEDVARSAVIQKQQFYLNAPFFTIRAVIYFLVWLVSAYLLRRWSLDLDRRPELRGSRRMRVFSAPAGALLGLAFTFASIDWAMSLEPEWSSTIYGMMAAVGGVLAAFALVVLVVALLDANHPLAAVLSPLLFNDLGSLLLAFVMMWAYLAFSQFMLIWAGNLTTEVPYYVSRLGNTWQWVGLVVALSNFVLPFLLLISRDVKRNPRLLALIALFLFTARWINGYWLVMPAFYPNGVQFSLLDLVLPLAMGGLWIGAFLWQLRGAPILPVNDRSLPGNEPMGAEE